MNSVGDMHVFQCASLKLKNKIKSEWQDSLKNQCQILKGKKKDQKNAQLIPKETRITKFNYA